MPILRTRSLPAVGVVLSLLGAIAACTVDPQDDTASTEQAVASNVHVLTSKNDLARTGANPKEKVLTTANVRAGSFGKVFSRDVDGQVYAQPLYVGGVAGKNVVYVATEHNSIFAFDADDTRAQAGPLWTRNFGPPVPATDTGCGLLAPEVGITSTPVIDLAQKTMWFTTRNKENGKFLHKLHALDIETGAAKQGSPTVITAQVQGNGAGSVGGVVRLDGLRNHNRPGLLKVGNKIYIAFASLCDIQDYHGWVLSYDATSLQQTGVHNTSPNGGEGGIWQGGVGLAADETGDVYYSSGDAYDTSQTSPWNGAGSFANSTVRLRDTGTALAVQSSFTPSDTRLWSPRDLSLGPIGGILIPGTQLYVTGDKRGQAYVVNRGNMGGSVAGDTQLVQKFQGTVRGAWGGAAYYKRGTGGFYYLWGSGDRLKAYRFDGQKFVLPAIENAGSQIGYPGGQLSVSSDGEASGTAIVWAVRPKRSTAGLARDAGPSVLEAFDAVDVTRKLWSSETLASDEMGNGAKFAPPTIANGRVFVGTGANTLVVYGLRNGVAPDAGAPEAGTDAGAADAQARTDASDARAPEAGIAPTWTQVYTQLLGAGTPGHCSGTGGCHTNLRGGFKCGTNKADCYTGLVQSGLVTPNNGAASPIGIENLSPLVWLGGSMPIDNPADNPAAAAMVKAWVAAGAKND